MRTRIIIVAVIVLLSLTNAFADLHSSNASVSSINDERAQIHLLLNSVTQAIQQQDLNALMSFVGPVQSGFEIDALSPSEQTSLDSLFAAGAGLAPTVATEHRDWFSTAFSFFNFQIDSIAINDASATVLIHADWRRRDLKAQLQDVYTVSLFRDGFSWQLTDLGPVLAAMHNYLSENQETLKLLARENSGATKSTWDDYNDWLSNSAVHLLIERDLYPPDFPRFTKTIAENELGGRVFQCAGTPSSYYYENDPLIGRTVSISAISDHCWQRFVVADLANEDDSYIFAKGRYGTGANVDDFAGPGGLEFRVAGLLYVCDRGNDRIKVIRIQPSDHQPILEYMRTGINEPADLDVTIDGKVIVAGYGDNEIW